MNSSTIQKIETITKSIYDESSMLWSTAVIYPEDEGISTSKDKLNRALKELKLCKKDVDSTQSKPINDVEQSLLEFESNPSSTNQHVKLVDALNDLRYNLQLEQFEPEYVAAVKNKTDKEDGVRLHGGPHREEAEIR